MTPRRETGAQADKLWETTWREARETAVFRLDQDLEAHVVSAERLREKLDAEKDRLRDGVAANLEEAAQSGFVERDRRWAALGRLPQSLLTTLILGTVLALVTAGGSFSSEFRTAFFAFAGACGFLASGLGYRQATARRRLETYETSTGAASSILLSQLVPAGREIIGQLSVVPFNRVKVRRVSGLSELIDPLLEVDTEGRRQLVDALQNMESASLGISGPRGAGKSTLLAAACDGRILGRPETLGVPVPAPIRYQSVEFVPYLFGRLCLAVLGASSPRRPVGPWFWMLFTVYLGAGLIAVGVFVGIGRLSLHGRTALAASLITAGALVVLPTYFRMLARINRRESADVEAARGALRRLRYRETLIHGVSAEAGPAMGLKLTRKQEVSAAEQAPTLPELVASYREMLGQLASSSRPVVIGIDELDKMEPTQAKELLNDVKVLFGVRHCYYLVSMSEDAMSSFARRGMPIRDVFDSSFDDVLRVEPLDLQQSCALIQRRVVGMGYGAQALCHCVAGGLPRELIRCVRAAVAATGGADGRLDHVVAVLVERRMLSLERATRVVATRAIPLDGRQPLLEWLDSLPGLADRDALSARWNIRPVVSQIAGCAIADDDRNSQQRLVLELAVAAYHADAIQRLFVGMSYDVFKRAVRARAGADAAVELLANARQAMTQSPRAAWSRIDQFRDHLSLDPESYPL
jgi:KAP-like P-loop domain-containing protein